MRTLPHVVLTVVFIGVLLLSALPTAAQTTTPTPAPAPSAENTARVVQVRDELERAEAAVDRAFSLLNLFEGIGLFVTLILGAVGLAGPVYTWLAGRRVQRATDEIEKTRATTKQEIEDTRSEVSVQLAESRKLQELIKELETRLTEATIEFRRDSTGMKTDVQDALDKLEREVAQNRAEFARLREELRASAEAQAARTTRALMGQSLQSLADRQYRETDFKGAIETYNRALDQDASNPITHYQLAYVYVHSDVLDKAEEHLQRALQLDPNLAQAIAALGYVYRRQAERLPMGHQRLELFNQAEAQLLKALGIAPRLIDQDGESWWGSLGGLYRRQKQYEQAIHAYKEAAQVTPRSSYPFSNLALLYAKTSNREAMLKAFEQVEQLAGVEARAESNNYWAYSDLFTAQLALNKIEEADKSLNYVFYLMPTGTTYPLRLLLETLQDLMQTLGGAQAAPHVQAYITRIEAFLDDHTNSTITAELRQISETSQLNVDRNGRGDV
jgi:tetratricopeptide (TPR) repeat protein